MIFFCLKPGLFIFCIVFLQFFKIRTPNMIFYLYLFFFLMKRVCYVPSSLGINPESLEGSGRSPLVLSLHLCPLSCSLTLFQLHQPPFPSSSTGHAPLSISCICCPQFLESFSHPETLRTVSLFTLFSSHDGYNFNNACSSDPSFSFVIGLMFSFVGITV